MISKRKLDAIDRLVRLGLYLIVITHIVATMWVGIGYFDGGWVDAKKEGGYLVDKDESTLYIAGIYWVITTFTTVGYGDFAGNNIEEFFYQMAVEFNGIMIFSYLMGNMNNIVGAETDMIALKVNILNSYTYNIYIYIYRWKTSRSGLCN